MRFFLEHIPRGHKANRARLQKHTHTCIHLIIIQVLCDLVGEVCLPKRWWWSIGQSPKGGERLLPFSHTIYEMN